MVSDLVYHYTAPLPEQDVLHSMTATLTLPAPAKLNLFLHITGRREDGYHNLQTLFQFLNISDTLTFERLDRQADIELMTEIPGVEPEQNLVVRAARLLQEHRNVSQGARIWLNKRLPMGGGIGGGSSNAATTLLALNRLWKTGLTFDELADLGLQLGADVPVFVRGHAAFGEGVGERLTQVNPHEYWYLVLVPEVGVNTAMMYNHPELTRDTPLIEVADVLQQSFHNDFQSLVCKLYPEVDNCRRLLDNSCFAGSGPACLSGSGACVFRAFGSEEDALAAADDIPGDVRRFIARACNESPLHRALIEHGLQE
ncbi:4-(cytidine 5'-diphospho)-2-C-methyl-D-erythritol kinase [Spongorhabdus nitratireducens]